MPPPNEQLLATLRRVPLFNELSEIELSSVADKVSMGRYDSGQVVFLEGDMGGDLLMVMEGSVKVVKLASNGRHQLLAIERQGSSLDEVAALAGGVYSATAIAVVPSVLIRLDGGHFRALCLARPELALKVIRVLGHRLRALRRLVEDLSFATVRDRLIAHLLPR